jgi:hypothetical protein
VYFPLDVLIVHLPQPTNSTDDINLLGIELAWGEIIQFGNLEFIANHLDNLSLSPEGNDLGVVFEGMAYSGSPSLYDILEQSAGEDDSASTWLPRSLGAAT